jgi:hypothetical protein
MCSMHTRIHSQPHTHTHTHTHRHTHTQTQTQTHTQTHAHTHSLALLTHGMRSNATCTTCIHAVKMSAGKVLDLLLATDDAAAWHDSNMRLNPHHYSRLARLAGPTRVAALADSAGGVYYNTHVVVAGRLIKYGVASTQTLVNDLNRWDRFYLAGRLQKPVKLLRCSPEVRASERACERASVCACEQASVCACEHA